jgi:tetratricopeptide (TPR) repeat protein
MKRPVAPESSNSAGSVSLWKQLVNFLKKSSVILLLVCMTVALVAAIARIAFPEYIVTVQQFEIAPEVAAKLSITGKEASNIVIDILNRNATDSSLFEGSDYYQYDHHGAQPVVLKGTIKIPVESSYGIEVNGISIDSLVKVYDLIRYQQWIIGGDIVSSPEGIVAKIRLNRDGSAKSWQTDPRPHPIASNLVENATALMLAEENPELLGRAYLGEGHYTEAAKVFQQWALRYPREWKPYYYLSLSYDFRGEAQKASNLANWCAQIMDHQKDRKLGAGKNKRGIIGLNAVSGFAEVTQIVWNTRNALSQPDKEKARDTLEQAIGSLHTLSVADEDPMYKIQLARALDQKAAIEASLNPTSANAYTDQKQAVDLLEVVVRQMPNNGGLHEQLGILLQHLVTIAQGQAKPPDVISNTRESQITELTKALELRPTQPSPLWGAVYALIDSKQTPKAVDLARTTSLLQPEFTPASTTAQAAYIVSLEHAKKETGNTEGEKDIELHLQAILGKASHSEVDALLSSFIYASDRKSLLETLHAYRELAKTKPHEHLPDLALTLNGLGELHRQNQRLNQSADAYIESLRIYRTLAKTNPQSYGPNVIKTVDTLKNLHREA